MNVTRLLNPEEITFTSNISGTAAAKKAKRGARNKMQKVTKINAVQEHVEKYNLMEELPNALWGILFGRLLRGDALAAQIERGQLFSSRKPFGKGNTTSSAFSAEEGIWKLYPVSLYWTEFLDLLDTGAIPILSYGRLLFKMGLEPTLTRKTITVRSGGTAGGKKIFKEVCIMFLEEVVNMDFLVVDGVPVDVLIRFTDLERLEATLDIR